MSDKATIPSRAEALLAAVSDAAPAGQVARFDPRYEQVLAEIAKLDSPSAAGVEWRLVVEQGSAILRGLSKDLLIGAHVAHGLHQLGGLEGCATGVELLAGLVERYWPMLYPEAKRPRARANALASFIERAVPLLGRTSVCARDRDALESAHTAGVRLAMLVSERMGADAPACRPLVEALDRLKKNLPAEAPLPETLTPVTVAPPAATLVPAPSVVPSTVPAASAPPAPAATAPPTPAGDRGSTVAQKVAPTLTPGADGTTFLRNFGAALASGATELRRTDATQPTPYRVVRTGLWLHLAALPAMAQGKSSVPAPPGALRQKLELMATHQKWPELLEEAESSLVQHRLWLDLHRYSVQCLAALGAAHAPARQAVIDELAAFLDRLPGLPALVYADGSPVADAATLAWLESTVTKAAAGDASMHSGSSAEGNAGDANALTEARRLIAEGKVGDGVALLQARVVAAGSGRARFAARLQLARAVHESGQAEVARALFVLLDEDLGRHGLEAWEPALAAECLVHHLRCVRGLVKGGRVNGSEVIGLFDRLCRLDPALALKSGTGTGP
jgi:type VI secretion system protein VasJ